ncbi:twin-arginine translocation signal domain-containing protein, partial [Proteiniphilum sp. UBA5375]|uniref:twin-arginine translocation signal domain-containing protein n=1 Tax=Proteiniphilum sp. UBA5375 TaxID=1947278 RepID=UPI00257BBC63
MRNEVEQRTYYDKIMKMSTNRRNFFKTVGLATAGLATGLHSDLLGMSLVTDQKKESKPLPWDQETDDPSNTIQRVKPVDHGEALINPGMGWVTYFYSNLYQNYGSKLATLGRVRPALLQELQKQPRCTHKGCQTCARSDHHQAH